MIKGLFVNVRAVKTDQSNLKSNLTRHTKVRGRNKHDRRVKRS